MKLAVVINVDTGPKGLAQATKTQGLLLDQMGTRLLSIRLAMPHLLQRACLAAVEDEPDLLAVAGGPRTARRAGQIAHEHGVPIVFLPGLRSPAWADKLWGALTLEDMIAALAANALVPLSLSAGCAGGQLFFESANCGVVPQLAQLRSSMGEIGGFCEGWEALLRCTQLMGCAVRPSIRIRCDGGAPVRASGLTVAAHCVPGSNLAPADHFGCAAWKHRTAIGYAGALLRATAGADWRRKAQATHFDCTQLSVDAGPATWMVLDEDAISYRGPVEFRFLPQALESFGFVARSESGPANIAAYRASAPPSARLRGRRTSSQRTVRQPEADKGDQGTPEP